MHQTQMTAHGKRSQELVAEGPVWRAILTIRQVKEVLCIRV